MESWKPTLSCLCVTDLIENLVKEKQELVAVRLSFGFGLCDKFQPVPLLRRYLNRAKKVSDKHSNMGKESREAQVRASLFFDVNVF